MYQIRGSFPKFIKNSYNLITKNPIFKMGTRTKYTFLQRRHLWPKVGREGGMPRSTVGVLPGNQAKEHPSHQWRSQARSGGGGLEALGRCIFKKDLPLKNLGILLFYI